MLLDECDGLGLPDDSESLPLLLDGGVGGNRNPAENHDVVELRTEFTDVCERKSEKDKPGACGSTLMLTLGKTMRLCD